MQEKDCADIKDAEEEKDKQISHIQYEMENLKLTIKEHEEDIFSKDIWILSMQNLTQNTTKKWRNVKEDSK